MRLQAAVVALLCVAPTGAATALAPNVAPDWQSRVERGLAQREYWASAAGGGLQAPNRAHGFRTRFAETGIRVESRSAPAANLVSMSLFGVGRGSAIAPAPKADAVVGERDRVEIRRPGLVEWYVNSPSGLEQGFTLAARPPGDGALVIELALSGGRPTPRGDEIVFERDAAGSSATGSSSWWTRRAASLPRASRGRERERVRIVVDDAGAVYPIVVDPLLDETADAQLESIQTPRRSATAWPARAT